ncbi:MAG: regulatory protein RecX [Gammaproteobacteria bacterium]|nr:regulatory protein RecX [Gammaproteobacteria bacterium]
MSQEIQKTIRRVALDLLARREHAPKELLQKLLRHGFQPDDIQHALDQLTDQNLLSKDRFIESYIAARRRKGFGPLHIQAELSERGIESSEIENHLTLNAPEWLNEVKTVWAKRFKNQLPKDFKERAKHMRFLQSRGFTSEQIQFAIRSQDA